MSTTRCPTCGHASAESTASAESDPSGPDPTVVSWFAAAGGGLAGDLHVSEVYLEYLRAGADEPVSRRRFLADLDFLGVEGDDDGNLAFG